MKQFFSNIDGNGFYDFKIKLDGKCLIFQDYVNYLGVLIDKQLNWSYHQEKLSRSLRQTNRMLSIIRYYLSQELCKIIYFALIHSILIYAIFFVGVRHRPLKSPLIFFPLIFEFPTHFLYLTSNLLIKHLIVSLSLQ